MADSLKTIGVENWGCVEYQTAQERQLELVRQRAAGLGSDQLVLVEHPPTVTLSRSSSGNDLILDPNSLAGLGITVAASDRGGKATFHAPGQLVAYPILKLEERDVHLYVRRLLESAAGVLRHFGLETRRQPGQPGLGINGRKIVSLGVAVRNWVVYHGLSLNVNNVLDGFNHIVTCSRPGQLVTSMRRELHRAVNLSEVQSVFIDQFCTKFEFTPISHKPDGKSSWLKKSHVNTQAIVRMEERECFQDKTRQRHLFHGSRYPWFFCSRSREAIHLMKYN